MQQQIDPMIWNVLQPGEQVRWWGQPGPNATVSNNTWKKLFIQSFIGGIPHELAPIKRVDQGGGWGDLSFGRRRGRFANIPYVGHVEQMLRSFQ